MGQTWVPEVPFVSRPFGVQKRGVGFLSALGVGLWVWCRLGAEIHLSFSSSFRTTPCNGEGPRISSSIFGTQNENRDVHEITKVAGVRTVLLVSVRVRMAAYFHTFLFICILSHMIIYMFSVVVVL